MIPSNVNNTTNSGREPERAESREQAGGQAASKQSIVQLDKSTMATNSSTITGDK